MTAALLRRAAALALVAIGGIGPVRAQEAVAPETLNPLHGLAKDKLTGFRDRPLFNPARMEPRAPDFATVAAPAPPPPPPAEPPALRLVGIVSGPRDLAVVRPAEGGKTTLLATGDKVGTWTVTVLSDGLRLQDGMRSVDLALFTRGNAPPLGGGAPASGVPSVKGADAFPPTGDPPPP